VQPIPQYFYRHLPNILLNLKNAGLLILFLQIPVTCFPLIHNSFPTPFPNTLNRTLMPSVTVYIILHSITLQTNTYAFHFIGLYPHYPPEIFLVNFRTIFKEYSGWRRLRFMGECCLFVRFFYKMSCIEYPIACNICGCWWNSRL